MSEKRRHLRGAEHLPSLSRDVFLPLTEHAEIIHYSTLEVECSMFDVHFFLRPQALPVGHSTRCEAPNPACEGVAHSAKTQTLYRVYRQSRTLYEVQGVFFGKMDTSEYFATDTHRQYTDNKAG